MVSIGSSVMDGFAPAAESRDGERVSSRDRSDSGDRSARHRPAAACRASPMRRAIRLATWPPLNPASMFTTTTLEAQLLSIPSSAATPWKWAP